MSTNFINIKNVKKYNFFPHIFLDFWHIVENFVFVKFSR